MSNTFTKFIDSCVGAITRKVQDEFDENKHPRGKGGKFTSKGNEGRGGGADDDEGYMGLSKEKLAEEEEYENARERARREKDDDRVTGPEDRDYMNEEDDDDPYEQDYEEGTSTTNLYGDKNQAPAVINALQYQYDGDAKKVGYIIRHLNSVTTNPEIWGEYTVKEIIDDIEDRYGKLDSMAKRHIDIYLRKTKPSEWDSETEYWKQKNKDFPGPKEPSFYE